MTPSPAITVSGLRVDRGGQTVLPGLSLEIQRARVCGLLGPSGGGKSTLLRAIVGTQIVAGGTVTVLGEPAGSAALRRRVGYMTQSGSIYGDLTVKQNLEFFARVLGAPAGRADEVVALVDLSAFAGRRVDRLSGGQRARVSLAAAMLGRPELLVLDEPTVGLDPVLRRALWTTFRRLADEDGVTLLVSSHVMDEARHCDDLILLRDGEVLAHNTPEALCTQTGVAAGDIDAAFLALVDQAESA